MENIWLKWLEDNYLYLALAAVENEEDQSRIYKIAEACKKHGVSLKKFFEVLQDI